MAVSCIRSNVAQRGIRHGRQPRKTSVFLDSAEVAALEQLEQRGTRVELRAVPSEAPLRLAQIKARFAAADRV